MPRKLCLLVCGQGFNPGSLGGGFAVAETGTQGNRLGHGQQGLEPKASSTCSKYLGLDPIMLLSHTPQFQVPKKFNEPFTDKVLTGNTTVHQAEKA